MKLFHDLRRWLALAPNSQSSSLGNSPRGSRRARPSMRLRSIETLEARSLFAADSLPVLMVIADSRDFYYQEYGDTRASIEAAGLSVRVAATTTTPSVPHRNTGEGAGGGVITPDLTLANVRSEDYSAIVFVGGWGSSMYQYSFPGNYYDDHYDGDLQTKATVNRLIGEFVSQDKYVTAICHAVTVLAWARVDGASPIDGKEVSVPWIGGPAGLYNGRWYGYFELTQYEQVLSNGATANTVSGQYGDPTTADDDVVVDGRIITAENYDSAAEFGRIIALSILADQPPPGDENHAPEVIASSFTVLENSPAATVVGNVLASDPDSGQTLAWAIVSGNTLGAFSIDASTGQLTVSNPAALDYESRTSFSLTVRVTDNGEPSMSATNTVTVSLQDQLELTPGSAVMFGGDLYVQGTSGHDWVYVWTEGGAQRTWINGQWGGPFQLAAGGRVIVQLGDGNDQFFGNCSRASLEVDGGAGDDSLQGGYAADILFGGSGSDQIFGNEGNDWLLGGSGYDRIVGGANDDLLIGGDVTFRTDRAAMRAIADVWSRELPRATRSAMIQQGVQGGARLTAGATVLDDGIVDCLNGSDGADWIFAAATDYFYPLSDLDELTRV